MSGESDTRARVAEDNMKWSDDSVKSAVIELLKEVNQSKLAKMCPLSQSMISNIANSKYTAKICPDKCEEFGEWFKKYRQESKEKVAFAEGLPKDARMTFHTLYELPKLREWYRTCKTPSRSKLQDFAEQLNNGLVRQQRQKVTPSRLRIWWKNEKQRERRLLSKNKSDEKTEGTDHKGENIDQERRQCDQETTKTDHIPPAVSAPDETRSISQMSMPPTSLHHQRSPYFEHTSSNRPLHSLKMPQHDHTSPPISLHDPQISRPSHMSAPMLIHDPKPSYLNHPLQIPMHLHGSKSSSRTDHIALPIPLHDPKAARHDHLPSAMSLHDQVSDVEFY